MVQAPTEPRATLQSAASALRLLRYERREEYGE